MSPSNKANGYEMMHESIPIIDYSLLTSNNADERSKAIKDLGNACKDWGCYKLVNHGVQKSVCQKILNASCEFFNMEKEDKIEFASRDPMNPIAYSNTFNPTKETKHLASRQALRLTVNPVFHCPHKPQGFSDVVSEYVEKTKVVGLELLKGISESLGLEASYMNEELSLESGYQIFAVNYYPFRSEVDHQRGMVKHSDHSFLTLIYENDVPGLEVLCNGEWILMNGVTNGFIVLNGDHLEIFSNGLYKRKIHRAIMKEECTRISLVRTYGPSVETIVRPSSRLVDENHPPRYLPKKFGEYVVDLTRFAIKGRDLFDELRAH
ncbi:2-oxoglutarate-dependent dioxygenase 19-like [Rutidosis leptorrhynchoides]|uniref:2-oxoglutarate-dependent dioxygenase 19-like n=1 Tax=Rutidosis leptorrhynchoides TaxID=125765 RepID=UPI003A998590